MSLFLRITCKILVYIKTTLECLDAYQHISAHSALIKVNIAFIINTELNNLTTLDLKCQYMPIANGNMPIRNTYSAKLWQHAHITSFFTVFCKVNMAFD